MRIKTKTSTVIVRVPDDVRAALDTAAIAAGVSLSEIVRRKLDKGTERAEGGAQAKLEERRCRRLRWMLVASMTTIVIGLINNLL